MSGCFLYSSYPPVRLGESEANYGSQTRSNCCSRLPTFFQVFVSGLNHTTGNEDCRGELFRCALNPVSWHFCGNTFIGLRSAPYKKKSMDYNHCTSKTKTHIYEYTEEPITAASRCRIPARSPSLSMLARRSAIDEGGEDEEDPV